MKKLSLLLAACFVLSYCHAQFVAKMELKHPIKGLCGTEVYSMLFKGQEAPVCPKTKEEIMQRLTAEVAFLKDSTHYNDKGMVSVIVNCKGEVVECAIDNKTRHPELDQQVVAVFNSLGKWKPGKLDGKKVDAVSLWSFEVKDGVIVVR